MNLPHRGTGVALISALCLAAATVPALAAPPTSMAEIGELDPPGSQYWMGYLTTDPKSPPSDYPDMLSLLPPPPEAGSPGAAYDEDMYQRGKVLRAGPRGEIAALEADVKSPAATQPFACVLNIDISEEKTPHLNALLRRTLNDTSEATIASKKQYQRVRPFRAHSEASCTPASDDRMKDDSYPSGHAAIGWGWALILSQIAPEQTDELIKRGYEYGQSRVICGVHWQSDVDAGRLAGAAAFARLQSEPLYQEQLELARAEVVAAKANGDTAQNCGLLAAE